MASSDLTWTEAESPVNQIEEYRIFRSVSVLVEDPGFADSFVLFATLPVVRDPEFPFAEVHPLSFSDTAVDFGTDTYCYRVDSVSVLVGEATGGSPQTGVGPSNIVCLGDPPSAVVLTGACVVNDVELDWTASTPALNAIAFYAICRSVNGGAFEEIAQVAEPGLSFIDTTADCENNALSYIVKAVDEAGIVSDDSNTLDIAATEQYFICCADDLASGQRIMTSTDGSSWTPQTIDDDNYEALAFAPDLGDPVNGRLVVMARGGSDNIKTSDNAGFSWIQRVSAASGLLGFTSITYSETLGLFAALSGHSSSNGNKVMTSVDGINWVLQTTPAGADGRAWASIRWIESYSLFLCAGIGGHSMRSSDGINWTYAAVAITIDQQATSGGRTVFSNPGDIANMFTDDGISFTHVMNPNGWNGGMRAIGVIGGSFVVMAGGAQGSWTSGNGSSWSGPNLPPVSHQPASYNSMAFGSEAGLLVNVGAGNGGDNILTSANGSAWGAVTPPVNGNWAAVIVAERDAAGAAFQEMVMVESNPAPNEAVLSVDGGNVWVDNDSNSERLECVAYSPTLDIFAALGDDEAASSPDGTSWTQRTSPNAKTWGTVIWWDELALFVGGAQDTGTTNLATSPDGINWTIRATPGNTSVSDLAVAPSGPDAIMGGRHTNDPVGNILHSTDGITWANPSGAHSQSRVVAVAYDTTRSRFVAVETLGFCNVSTTGASGWSLDINSQDLGTGWTADNCNMTYSETLDLLILVGNNGVFSSSDGGVNWVSRDSTPSQDVVYSVSNGKFYACNLIAPRLQSSPDGIDWTDHQDPAGITGAWRGIALGATV